MQPEGSHVTAHNCHFNSSLVKMAKQRNVIHKLNIENNERRKPETKTKQKLIHNVYKQKL